LPSLARRFPCLEAAKGVEPWNPEILHKWAEDLPRDEPAYHAAALILNLWGSGPWDRFDILFAARVWEEADRQTFVDWLRAWHFRT
jgi:hypothetical protein